MKQLWTPEELALEWTLHPDEHALLANKSGHTRLGFAVLLRSFAREGRFPDSRQGVPGGVVAHVARQVGVEPGEYLRYDWDGRTIKYHRAQIREFLGFREATVRDAEELTSWLAEGVLPRDQRPEYLLAAVHERCRGLCIEPPSPGRLDRLVASALRAYEGRFCADVIERLSPETLRRMDALLETGTPGRSGGAAARRGCSAGPPPSRGRGRSGRSGALGRTAASRAGGTTTRTPCARTSS